MARRRRSGGGFGGGGWLGNAGSTASGGPATAPPRRTKSGGALKVQSSITRRERKQEKRQKERDASITDPAAPGDSTSPLDEEGMDLAFEDPNPDTLRLGAMGMLNRAGINLGPDTPTAQRGYIEDTVGSWVDQHLGDTLVNDPTNTWGDFLDDVIVPGDQTPDDPLAATPEALSYGDWADETLGISDKERKDLEKKKRERLKKRYQTYADEFAATNPGDEAGGGAPDMSWVWNEGIRDKLTRGWEGLSPSQRGYNSAQWVAPKRTIQF